MRVRRLSRVIAAVPLAVALSAAGCVVAAPAAPVAAPAAIPATKAPAAVPATRAPAARAGSAAGDSGATRSGDTDGTDTVEEFRRDMKDAQRVAEGYWKGQFAASGDRFQPIREVIPYTEDGEVVCGEQPIGLNNAAYCPAGDFIAYDVNWAFAAFQQVGDAFIFYLLGHEYAHAIQRRLAIRAKFTIQQELQADCMAGAYLGDSERAGPLRVTDDDIEEFRRGLAAVGDEPGQPWFAEGSHGTARQRTESFVKGYEDSLPACGLS